MKYAYMTKKGKKKRITEKLAIKYSAPVKSDSVERKKYKIKLMKRLIKVKSISVNTKAILGTRLGVDISRFMEIKERVEAPEQVEETEMKIKEEEKQPLGLVVDGLVSSFIEYGNQVREGSNFYCEFKFSQSYKNKNDFDEEKLLNRAEDMMREVLREEFRQGLGDDVAVDKTTTGKSGIEQMKDEFVDKEEIVGELAYGHSAGYKQLITYKGKYIESGIPQ